MTDPPPPKRRGSLRRQVLLPLLALGVAALLLGTAGTFRLIDFLLERRLREQAESISSSASAVVENIARATELQRVISAMSAEPDVTFIIVVAGEERRVIASSRHKWIGKTLADLPYESLGEDLEYSLRTHRSLNHGHPEIGQFDHSEYARLTLPELAHVAPVDGAVMVRIDTRRIRSDTLRSVMFVMISSTVTLVVLITLGYYLMWRHVVQPLRDVAGQLSASDGVLHSVSLGAAGGGEMHSLVDALNRALHERREAENRERQQRRVERLRADLIEELTRPFTTMTAMLRVCCEALSRHLDASFVGVWLLQADSRRLELVASAGLKPRNSGPLFSVEVGETEIGVIARDGRPHLSQAGAKSNWCAMFADATPADLASVAGYPLGTEAGLCGVLAVCSRSTLSPEIQLGLNSIASTVVQVILRRQTQDMLHESQEQYRLLADNADDFVLLSDGEGRRLYVSPSYYRVTGWTPEEVRTGDWRRRLHPDDMPTIELARERNLRGESTTIEHRVGCKDGTWIWVELHCKPILSADGRIEKLLQWSRDITERKRNAELLQEALKAAEAANEAKSEFLAIMSHEIRTPINGIMGMLDLTLETPLAEDQHEQLTLARSAADSLRAILNDILDFSKIEAGKLQLEHAPFSLRKTIAQAVRTISLRAAEKQLEVRIEDLGEIPDAVLGDAGRLTQVLLNLLSNAVKFTERGSIRIGAARHSCDGGRMQLQLFVADTGPGIPETKRELIFHAFEQADHSITRRHGGTGLGLAICSRLVKMMGGRIWVESEVGAGSTFYFTTTFELERPAPSATAAWPATAASDASLAEGTSTTARPPDPGQTSRPTVGTSRDRAERALRVLLVEDEDVNREVAIRILGRRGHSVTATPSGRHALEAWSADPDGFDVLITDISMPEVGGVDLTRQIREREAAATTQRRLPIVAMTANAMKGDAERFISVGMDGYVAKPISRDAFVRTIEAAARIPHRPDEDTSPSNALGHDARVDLKL